MCDHNNDDDRGVSRRLLLGAIGPAIAAATTLNADAQPAPVASPLFDRSRTALLIVDPYNDFLSPGGKLYAASAAVMQSLKTVEHMRDVLAAARSAGIAICFVPHRRWKEGDFAGWSNMPPVQAGAARGKVFADGTWGGDFHPDFQVQPGDIVAQSHWMSSGFADTDLERQLRAVSVDHVIIVGMRANTCIESTMRYAAELGFRVTLVKDAIGAFSMEEVRSATEINGPSYASSILTTAEVIAEFKNIG